jgi:hypothetical protein
VDGEGRVRWWVEILREQSALGTRCRIGGHSGLDRLLKSRLLFLVAGSQATTAIQIFKSKSGVGSGEECLLEEIDSRENTEISQRNEQSEREMISSKSRDGMIQLPRILESPFVRAFRYPTLTHLLGCCTRAATLAPPLIKTPHHRANQLQ